MEFYLLKAWTTKRKSFTKKQFSLLNKFIKRTAKASELSLATDWSSLNMGDFRFIEKTPTKSLQFMVGYERGISQIERQNCTTLYSYKGDKYSFRAITYYKDIFVSFTDEYTQVHRDGEIIWKSKQYISHGRNKYAHLCEAQLYFVDWNNTLLHLDLDQLLIKIANGISKNSDIKIYDKNVKDVAIHSKPQLVVYMKSDAKGITTVFCAKKPICQTQTSGASFACIAKFNKYVALGGCKKDKETGTYQGILELVTDHGDNLSCQTFKLYDHHEDQIAVIRMFKVFAHVFVAAMRFHQNLDIYAIYNDELITITSIKTLNDTKNAKIWHRDMKVVSKSACNTELIIVTDKKLITVSFKV